MHTSLVVRFLRQVRKTIRLAGMADLGQISPCRLISAVRPVYTHLLIDSGALRQTGEKGHVWLCVAVLARYSLGRPLITRLSATCSRSDLAASLQLCPVRCAGQADGHGNPLCPCAQVYRPMTT